jgi:hypothetical protein
MKSDITIKTNLFYFYRQFHCDCCVSHAVPDCAVLLKIKTRETFNRVNIVRVQVLKAANVKFAVFWDVALCCHFEVDRRFRGTYCLHHQGDNGGSTHLWNVDKLQRDYTVLHPRRLNLRVKINCRRHNGNVLYRSLSTFWLYLSVSRNYSRF